ncbi:hypothetical protein L211DRAFT_850684 [Terfezia boudieri ATCC MYA-4762]|uniref:Uncharacterized protein n=1 Tax=Terfezia boudieri ATCC MYA-4762 TaxID=1051890 RepID=A0A3N4LI14_9PEZI|nr:hypothetical protein L211DRAFT_850684 [Terfezia boudieri ATCC MYA-4762]
MPYVGGKDDEVNMLYIPEEHRNPRGEFEELFAEFGGHCTWPQGGEEAMEEEFLHPMLELAAIVGTENEFVRRWLEEEEQKKRRKRDLRISEWVNEFCGRGFANDAQDPIV